MTVIRLIPLASIGMDHTPINPKTLDLVDYLRGGGVVPSIHVRAGIIPAGAKGCVVREYDICDGRHRVIAYKLLGRNTIAARIAYNKVEVRCAI